MKKRLIPNKTIILKTLIGLGIIAIIISVYIQYGKPYIKELSLQKQDEQRVKDLDTLSEIMKDMIAASSTKFIGNNNTIYISIPSDNSNCTNLDLPSVPEGWQYHCVANSTLNKADGTGWIPVKLSEKIKKLPIDPINNPETLNYYAYVASSTNEYVLTGVLDSKKLLKEKAQNDGGVDDIRYEVVSMNNKLWSDAEGLIGYWPMNEGSGSLVKDKSKFNNSGKIKNLQNWKENSLYFNGNNYVEIDDSEILQKIGEAYFDYTIITSFKSDTENDQSISEKWIGNSYPFSIRGPYPGIRFAVYDGKNNPGISSESNYSDSKWHQVVAGRDTHNKSIFLYVDGKFIGTDSDNTINDISNKGSFPIGARNVSGSNNFNGSIKGFYIYNKVFKPNEVERLFSLEKN